MIKFIKLERLEFIVYWYDKLFLDMFILVLFYGGIKLFALGTHVVVSSCLCGFSVFNCFWIKKLFSLILMQCLGLALKAS